MAKFCLNHNVANAFLSALKSGELAADKLVKMSSADRRQAFGAVVGKENAQEVNARFEKALVSSQKNALTKWAQKLGGLTPERKQTLLEKIKQLDAVLTPESEQEFLADLAADRLGISVTAGEAKRLTELATNLQEATQLPATKTGLPPDDYWKALKEMRDYIQGRNPASFASIASSWGRKMLLTSLKSPLLNIESNTVQGIIEGLTRRLSSGKAAGVVPSGKMVDYVKYAVHVQAKYGFDVTRLLDASSLTKKLGEDVAHSQGQGWYRALGRVSDDIVFNKMLQTPDVAFSASHKADSVNLMATKVARSEGLKGKALRKRANEIFDDAIKLAPETALGKAASEQGIADAMYATYQNQGKLGTLAGIIRNFFNEATGSVRLGDQLVPFVKTPANVIEAGLDGAGLGYLKALHKLYRAVVVNKDFTSLPVKELTRDIVRSTTGITAAIFLANSIKPEDFIGAYPSTSSEKELLDSRKARENSIKIGQKWVSLDYFGPLAAPMVGLLYAKKYGKNFGQGVAYAKGVGSQLVSTPGLDVARDFIEDAVNIGKTAINKDPKGTRNVAINTGLDFFRSRLTPGIFYDITKGTDQYERDLSRAVLEEDPYAKLKSATPGQREKLPIKKTVFGESIKGETLLSNLLFGSRVKTGMTSEIVREMVRLDGTGNLPILTDSTETSDRFQKLKTQKGQGTYDQAVIDFRRNWSKKIDQTISSGRYRKMDNEEKKKELDKLKQSELDKIFGQSRYKLKKEKKK